MSKEMLADDFLFGGMDDSTMSVFDKNTTNNDGIYRPNLKDAKDKKIGYRSTVRFLPNLLESGKLGPNAIEKHIHYVDMKNDQSVSGYYDCRKNNEPNCELCTEYWKLYNSKNAADNEKANLLKRSTKYYSYVMIVEDEQHPDLVGKVLVWPFGYTIKEKINSERNGDVSGHPTNIFDLLNGKDFKLIIKDKAGFQNYDASQFMESSVIKIYDEASGKFKTAPVNADNKIDNPKVMARIKETLTSRTSTIEEHAAKEWDEQTKGKVEKVLNILSGTDVYVAEQKTNRVKNDASTSVETVSPVESNSTDVDDFFDIE